MKHMKKLAGLVLALVMAFAMTMTAFAANVTVPNELSGHTFKAYQIFTGTQAVSEGALGDVEWGNGINSDAFLVALKNDTTVGNTFTNCKTASDVATALGGISDDLNAAEIVAKWAYANKKGDGIQLISGDNNNLADGYYLIVDATEGVSGTDDALNKALLQVTGNIEITKKTDKPSVEKKVKEDDKYQGTDYGAGYNDVADYNMGDAVPFKLIGKVPDMTYYDTYKYIFHDTMSNGLTLNENSVHVYVVDSKTEAGTPEKEITNYFTITKGDHALTVSCDDIKTISGVEAGKYIIVEYTATLNQNAVVGLDGNPNKVYLEYSNNPNQGGEGETGRTPEDKVIVFTYELDTTKVDGENSNTKLEGAEFKLKNEADKWVIVDTNGNVTGWAETEAEGSTLRSGADGLFKVIGLDDGTYYLKETKAPAGYNLLKDEITVVISATTANGQNWTDGQASSALTKLDVTADGVAGTGNATTGVAGITVANNKGATLPETGGIGTTIFYVLGSILVIGAAVALITRRRMSKH